MTTIRSEAPSQLPPAGRAALRAGVVGNWIDNIHVFLPSVALAPAMASLTGSASAGLGSLVVVALLLGRPVGGAVFGAISDRWGRTRMTRAAILGTALCAALIAVLPPAGAIGAAAFWLLVLLRFLGGIFVAGEYSAAIPLAMEWSAPRRRGLNSGLILSMAPWAQAVIAFATAAGLALLGTEAYAAWGWRVLFAVGALGSIAMFLYYGRRVTDAPVFRREHRESARPDEASGPGALSLLVGRQARTFWQVFALMSGLWLLTAGTVLILPSQLAARSGFTAGQVSLIMGAASVAQALAMAVLGHLSTLVGRRLFFVLWGLVAAGAGSTAWIAVLSAVSAPRAAVLAAALQVVTVSGYGPVSAYLTECFSTRVRSTAYGMGYSWSLVLPALYPFWLPLLDRWGAASVPAVIVAGGLLVSLAALLGPRLAGRDLRTLDP